MLAVEVRGGDENRTGDIEMRIFSKDDDRHLTVVENQSGKLAKIFHPTWAASNLWEGVWCPTSAVSQIQQRDWRGCPAFHTVHCVGDDQDHPSAEWS